MRVATFEAIGEPLIVGTTVMPVPASDEVLLQVDRCGICGSDLHMTEDPIFCVPKGTVLGHEFAGTVVERGKDVQRLRNGDRVSILPIRGCGECTSCRAGSPAWCIEMLLHGGGYGEFTAVKDRQCVLLPSTLSQEDGALVEPLAVGLHGIRMADMPPGARVLIVGSGPIGLATAYWARLRGAARIAVTATSFQRRELALQIGADTFLSPEEAYDPEVVRSMLGGPPDIVFECVGKPGVIARCIDMVKPRGTVVVLGLCTGTDHFQPFAAVSKEVRVQTAVFYDLRDFERSAAALDDGHVEARAMITDRITLAELPEMFESLRARSSQCKVLVSPRA